MNVKIPLYVLLAGSFILVCTVKLSPETEASTGVGDGDDVWVIEVWLSETSEEEERQMVEELTFADKLKRPITARIGVGNLFLDFIWYPRSNHSLLISLMTDLRDEDGVSGIEVFVLPGIGYSYRSIGRLAAGIDTALYAGGVFGAHMATAYTLWGISPSVGYNFSPNFGISIKFASLYLSLDPFFTGSPAVENNLFFQRILALSLVYRP